MANDEAKTAVPGSLQRMFEGKIRWPYRDSRTGKHDHVALTPHEFIRRFLQHVLPPAYHRVRCFGWLHPAGKLRANRARALLGAAPLLTAAEQQAWLPPSQETEEIDPPEPLDPPGASAPTVRRAPCCPNCRQAMTLVATWKPGRAPPLLLARAAPT